MQGSYRTARIVETRNLLLGRLRHCVWAVEQDDCNLLVGAGWKRELLWSTTPCQSFAERTRRATTTRRCYDCCCLSSECDQQHQRKRVQFSHHHFLSSIVNLASPRSVSTFSGCKLPPSDELLQLPVLGLGFLQDGDAGVAYCGSPIRRSRSA